MGGEYRLEFPIGRVLYADSRVRRLHSPRVSPDGQRVALFERSSDTSRVITVSTAGDRRIISDGGNHVKGSCLAPDGDEIWFTTALRNRTLGLHAASLSGRERVLLQLPKSFELFDAAEDGRVLVGHIVQHQAVSIRRSGSLSDQIISTII